MARSTASIVPLPSGVDNGMSIGASARTPRPVRRTPSAAGLALTPAWLIVLFAYVATAAWSICISFTSSKLLPTGSFVGLDQYARLFGTPRWNISLQNVAVFGVLFTLGCLVIGSLLAIALDQKVRFENTFRTIFLYPYALSFIVTGLTWQWIMNPQFGVQEAVRALGWSGFVFDWAVRRETALFAVVIAGVWQSSGLVMTLVLAGLRGVDSNLISAARIDGVPTWRIYVSIILPELVPMLATATVLLATGVVRVYDLVVALTNGGPGTATEVPAKFVMDFLFARQNLGLATAGSTIMLMSVLAIISPWAYMQYFKRKRERRVA
jgi:glucose/mannose transport system permease protein